MKRPPIVAGIFGSRESVLQRARLKGLRNLAEKVFRDRNANGLSAPGTPKGDRLTIKAEMRPNLRQAIHWTRKSRDALLAGDVDLHELLRDRARMFHAHALIDFYQPYANRKGQQYAQTADNAAKGGRERGKELVKATPGLDDLIDGYIERDETVPVAEYVRQFNVSRSTIYRRIEARKKKR